MQKTVQDCSLIISLGRALGPEVGVSIGLCFFLGNAVAGALYVLGAVETFLKAIPAAGIFKDLLDVLPSKSKVEDGGYSSDDGPEDAQSAVNDLTV
ncbi:hypothetical protein RIF29_08273 [Crotalaria pallida]|uniref:Uncharacterized protein n=1 Tax=Crotalaria pallida TaxID=3830 RepID=A0AAN9J5K1_CROPI